ncbi:hypothetical protein [Sphingomonas sp. ERG5]|uniref:hypothetical protein n=1 Tax=Sphingomonas sp. ERG5 TaxID=1381597 RepID=UPI00054BE28D|nr:hypothetical protein [Sphingomonas sp. ERG5]
MVIRESLALLILWRIPGTLLIIAFLGAWFAMAGQSGGQASVWHFGRRYAVAPEPARIAFLAIGACIALIFLIGFIRGLYFAAGKSIVIAPDGVGVTFGAQHRRLFSWALSGIRVNRLMIGARIRVSDDTPPFVVSVAEAQRAIRALDRLGVTVRTDASFPVHRDQTGLLPAEAIIWEGRPGLLTFMRSDGWVAVLAVPLPLIFVRWLWWIWTEPGWAVSSRFFWSFFALMLVGNVAIGLVAMIVGHFDEWFRELAGTIAVTDRRIIWRAPRGGDVYREIQGNDILAGALVENNGRRGWIGLSISDEEGEVREIDLRGLPHPDNAIAAIEALMRSGDGVGDDPGQHDAFDLDRDTKNSGKSPD